MLVVVTGGSNSGKSEWAEEIAGRLCKTRKIYLATMVANDTESIQRVEAHRLLREGKQFVTIEQGTHIETLDLQGETCVLLECMSNLVANEMYDKMGVKIDIDTHIMRGIEQLLAQVPHVVIVTNEVFSGMEEDEETMRYLAELGQVNQKMVARANMFVESVYGIPILYKGNWEVLGGAQ
ncbi:bifunctional adenosylcobinamide kinase/adenosylcobinamide-phosphate guanylyltransferase [Lachnospiraceae bacterium LCP25S3_G4]